MNKTIVREITEADEAVEYTLGERDRLTLVLFLSGNGKTVKVRVRLNGKGAKADVIGFVVGKGENTFVLQTFQKHAAEETMSNLLVKSVLADEAKFFYDGGIKVERNAQKTDAYQRNENLLLSKNTAAQSSPALEILANDVRCTHGATLGRVPQEQLWYLATRGIPKKEAQQLIVSGFFQSALDRVEDQGARREIEKKLWQML